MMKGLSKEIPESVVVPQKKKKTTFWRMDAPPKTNMLNAKMQVWNMIFLFRHVIFSFHVSFRVCVHSPQKRVIFLSSWLLVRRVATPTCPFLWKIWIPLFGGGQVPKNINSYVYYIYIYLRKQLSPCLRACSITTDGTARNPFGMTGMEAFCTAPEYWDLFMRWFSLTDSTLEYIFWEFFQA